MFPWRLLHGSTAFPQLTKCGAGRRCTLQIYQGNGNNTFTLIASHTTIAIPDRVLIADYNNDGLPDIFVGGSSNVNVFALQGDGTFGAAISMSAGARLRALGDFNNDGVLDLVGSSTTNVVSSLATTTTSTNIQRLNLTTQADARASLSIIDSILERINKERGAIGAAQSRLGIALSHLQQTIEGHKSAEARITDADVGKESSELTRNNILRQTAAAVLAQANLIPSIALDLLRNN